MSMVKLTRDQFIPFLEIGGDLEEPEWARIDYSTIFSLNPGTQTETVAYICYAADVTEVTGYQPELPQEIALYEGNDVYDFMFGKFFDLPIGEDAKVPVLICFGGEDALAWLIPDATVTLGELNTVDGKLSFTLNLGGTITRGTYTITDGVPEFDDGTSDQSGDG